MRDQITANIERHTATLQQAQAKLAALDRERAETLALIQRLEGARQGLAELLVSLPRDVPADEAPEA